MVARSRRILKFIQKVKKSKSQKVSLFAKSCTFRLFGQFFTFRLCRQKFKKSHFSQKVEFFDFSGSFLTFRLCRQKFKKSHFSQKVALFDFSGSFLTFRLFGQKFKKSHFSQKVALFDFSGSFSLFDFSGKNSKSRTFRKKLNFSMSIYPLFSPKYRIWDMSPTRQYLSIRPVSAPSAADIGYGNIGYCPTSVSTSPPFPSRNTGYGICTLRVRIYLSAPSAADIRCGILPHGRRCRIGYGM